MSSLKTLQGNSGDQFVEQLFRVFDKDGDGGIDFKVVIRLASVTIFYLRFSSVTIFQLRLSSVTIFYSE